MTCHICASPTCLGECEDYPRCKKCGDYMHPNFPCEEAKALREPEEDYDVVVDVLTKHKNKLWEMTRRNMQSEYIQMNIMDDIRLAQIDKINEAISVWKKYKYEYVDDEK